MNSYREVLEKIFTHTKAREMERSLSNITRLCEIFNHPETAFPSIHVAGTNGKGSVCTKLAHILQKSGYRSALYTSPHISSFRERIQIDGEMISEEDLCRLFTKVEKGAKTLSIKPFFFEITTCIAFLYFAEKKVDIAIIETGLGGRFDATNVIDPILSIITSIGFDHTEILGSTLEKIALEKAGIIKEKRPTLVGHDLPKEVIQSVCRQKSAPYHECRVQNQDYTLENEALVAHATLLLPPQFIITKDALEKGLRVRPPCRFEIHMLEKIVILDVAHNPHGLSRLFQNLKLHYPHYDYRFVVGFSKDKEIGECVALIQKVAIATHITSAPHPKLAPVEMIEKHFKDHEAPYSIEESITSAISNALKAPSKNEIIVVTGSFYIMEETRKALHFLTSTS